MALSHYISYTTTGTKDSVNLDPSVNPFNATVGCAVAVSATYKLQYSLDPITTADASCDWFDSANIPAGTTASAVTNIFVPVTKVRVIIAALGASGSVSLKTLQGFQVG